MHFAGVDWADDHHDCVVLDATGKRVGSIRVPHSAEGLAQLTGFLHSIRGETADPGQVACIIETNHGLLISALLDAGLPVYPVNPSTVDRHRKPSGAKTDAIDAYLLARTGRSDLEDLRRLTPDNPIIAELKLLTRDQDGLIQSQTRLINQLKACLKAYYPTALTLFKKLQQPCTLAFLRAFPTLQAAQAAAEEQIGAALTGTGHPEPQAKAQEIRQKLAQPCLAASAEVTRAKSRLMLSLAGQLELHLRDIAAYDAEITRLFLSHSDSTVFASLPRAKKRIAPRLLAEWGDDRERFDAAANVQALAGTSPVVFASGQYSRVHCRHACSKPFRNVLYQFAGQSILKDAWAAAYYQRKRDAGKSYSMALRALANQWVRIIYAMWQKHERYDPAVFAAARQKHAPRAA